ncbi:MAG: TraR/DksA C4-type zinc finger protein, partial [Candidatus Thermoplasmatota archaeon]|nr:TraR/DksA C4-type zinc finger protein [Candidatus Thermoplasmatota archaeon]
GRGIRFVTKKDAGEEWNDEFPKYEKLFENIVEKREGTEEDERKFSRLGKEVSHHIAELPAKDLFDIEKVDVDIPEYAPIHDSHICEKCGEKVMATRTVEKKGKILCLECSDSDHHELTSFGIKIRG